MAANARLESYDAGSRYRALAADIELADRVLEPAYADADARALDYQRRFVRAELTVIWGGVVAVGLGVLAGTTSLASFSFAASILTAGLGALAALAGGLRWHRRWLRYRWQAESLRGERFLFIGRVGEYAAAAEPDRLLKLHIAQIDKAAREVRGDV
jgi:hypothetical protein